MAPTVERRKRSGLVANAIHEVALGPTRPVLGHQAVDIGAKARELGIEVLDEAGLLALLSASDQAAQA